MHNAQSDCRTIVDLQHIIRELRHEVANTKHTAQLYKTLFDHMMRRVPGLIEAVEQLEGTLSADSESMRLLAENVLPRLKDLTDFDTEGSNDNEA